MIKEGETFRNFQNSDVQVVSVLRGEYGLRVEGKFVDDSFPFLVYLPFELSPPDKYKRPWLNWGAYGWVMLEGGCKLGALGVTRFPIFPDIRELDSQWAETTLLMGTEEHYTITKLPTRQETPEQNSNP